jgi:hypothetical protein
VGKFIFLVLTCSNVVDEVHVLVDLEVFFQVSTGEPVLAAEVSGDGEALRVRLAVDLHHRELPEWRG